MFKTKQPSFGLTKFTKCKLNASIWIRTHIPDPDPQCSRVLSETDIYGVRLNLYNAKTEVVRVSPASDRRRY
jgi:hypothetical protein